MKDLNIQCSVRTFDDVQIQKLKDTWQKLFKNSHNHFFLSWRWIAPLCSQILAQKLTAYLIEVTLEDECIGLAIFIVNRQVRHRCLSYSQLLLHKSGQETLDQQWIEYNDFLLHRMYEEEARNTIWRCIENSLPKVDEIIIGLTESHVITKHCNLSNNRKRWNFIESTGYETQLDLVNSYAAYYATLSKSFQRQIRTSDTLLLKHGYRFKASTDIEFAHQVLDELAPLHIKHWGAQSGFNNLAFKQYLTETFQAHDETSVFAASYTHDNTLVAGLFGFIHNHRLYFYLSANKRLDDNKMRLGISLHSAVLNWCFDNKIKYYDFLAGDYRYKRSFANKENTFVYSHLQRNSFPVVTERTLRRLKKYLVFMANFVRSMGQ